MVPSIPSVLEPAVQRVEHALLRIVLRPVLDPPPLAFAAGAGVGVLVAVPTWISLALLLDGYFLPLVGAPAILATVGLLRLVYLAFRGVRALHLEVTPHQLRIRTHDALGMRTTVLLRSEIRDAALSGPLLEVRTWDEVLLFPVPDRATVTRDALADLLRELTTEANVAVGDWQDVPPTLRRTWKAAGR